MRTDLSKTVAVSSWIAPKAALASSVRFKALAPSYSNSGNRTLWASASADR
jgi:hypothetical protein